MGSVYMRPDSPYWWLWFLDAKGERIAASTRTKDEKKARKMLADLEKEVARSKARAAGEEEEGTLTLGGYGARLLKRREASGIESYKDDKGRWEKHVASHPIAKLPLEAVRPGHLRDFMRELAQKDSPKGGKLSPRTQNHVYALLRVLFADAVADELLATNPCVLKVRRKELPAKRDKDAAWRSTAVFTHEEVEQLISDPRVPEDRRVLYAILFLTGERFGEVADQRFSSYDPTAKPLGRLLVASSFSVRRKESKETKTGAPRAVPVHPTLAQVLAGWKLGGWARMLGRPPTPEDWLIPSRMGQQRRVNHALRRFHEDLELLGLRERRIHDARRTFISLAQADGAEPHILQLVTHDAPGDQFNQYTTIPWPTLCREVAKLQVSLRGEGVTVKLRPAPEMKNPPSHEDLAGGGEARSTGLEPEKARALGAVSRNLGSNSGGLAVSSRATSGGVGRGRNSVTGGSGGES
jgi:integrase